MAVFTTSFSSFNFGLLKSKATTKAKIVNIDEYRGTVFLPRRMSTATSKRANFYQSTTEPSSAS